MVAFWAVLGLGPLGLPGGFPVGGLFADRTALQQVAAYLLREAEPFVDDLAKSLLQGRSWWCSRFLVSSGSPAERSGLEYAINVAFATVRRRRFWRPG